MHCSYGPQVNVATSNWPFATKVSLQWYLSSDGQKTHVATVAPTSDGRADIICPLLLESTVERGMLTSAHPSLLDRKHNMHSVYKRKYNLHTISE
jgi:hypothetical protein